MYVFTLEFIGEVIIRSFDVTARLPGSFCSNYSAEEEDCLLHEGA